jgi:hypothetical protein
LFTSPSKGLNFANYYHRPESEQTAGEPDRNPWAGTNEGIAMDKQTLGLITITLTLLGYVPFFRSILQGHTRPHIFTWITWALVTAIAFAGQWTSGAGAGSWSLAISFCTCLAVIVLSHFYGEKHTTKSDRIAFGLALAAIPMWYFTKDALGALILVTFIYMGGSYPMLRKSWVDPYSESLLAWSIFCCRSLIVLFAIEHYSLTTLIYPTALVLINVGLILILALRRRISISKTTKGVLFIGKAK